MKQRAKNIQQYIRLFVDESSTELNPFILQGRLNNEFIKGNQNKKINRQRLTLEDKGQNQQVYTEKKIFNRMLPIYLTRYGILARNMPIPGIIPYNSTSKAAHDSIQTNNFINNFILDSNFKANYQKAIKRADVYGLEWFKTGIDWSDGDKVCDIETKIGDQAGTLTLKEGRPFITPVPMSEVFIDSYYVETMDDVNELVHRRVFPIDYIRKRWGFEAEKESINAANLSTYPRYSNMGMATAGDIEYAYVYEYYKKPDAVYPNGRYVITCNDKVLWDDILPYKNGIDGTRCIPFDFLRMQSVPHNLFGVTVYSQIIPIQETYNAVKNRYLEYVNHIAIGQLYYWEGSLINKNNVTNKPGKLIGLKRNARAPQPVQKDKLSAEFVNYLKSLEEDMLVTAGLSQMTAFGQTKSNVRTDGVVDKLTESDENKLGNALDSISECLISVFKKLLYLEKQREETLLDTLKLAKMDNYVLTYKLMDVDAEQITIVNRDFLMQSDQIFDKKLQQAGNLGLYNPQANIPYSTKLEFLNSMHASYLKDTLDPVERATYELCIEENEEAFKGAKMPEAEEFHIHTQHINEHNLFRISPEVRKLRKDNYSQYKILMESLNVHIEQHKKFMQNQSQGNVYENAKAALQGTAKKPRS